MAKMYVETLEVAGFLPALQGMRNPKNSWHLSDSTSETNYLGGTEVFIGKNDLKLAKLLTLAGTEHCKFLRQIQVWANVNMPLYWWSEMDTYKFGTKNSCSTMHKLFNKDNEITLDMFVFDEYERYYMEGVVIKLNNLRTEWLLANAEKDQVWMDKCLIRAKKILPTGFLQLRTWNTNYQEIMNMYHQRKHHRLKEEWIDTFCRWCESLPYFKEICVDNKK